MAGDVCCSIMLYRDYDPGTLATLQRIQISIFKDFDALCHRHGIRYFGCGGTAIGALRHKGMIPWDDDIDVHMLREDYEKFLGVANEPGDKYYLLNSRIYPEFPCLCTRICLRGTVFQEECFKHLDNIPWGIFIDLFPIDPTPDDHELSMKQMHRAWVWGKLMTLRSVRSPVLYAHGLKATLITIACFFGHYLLRMFFSPGFLARKAEGLSRQYENRTDVKCSRAGWFFESVPYKSIFPVADLYPARRAPFNTIEIDLSRETEAYLTRRFGDYMRMPDPKDRHNHPPWKLDFGPYGAMDDKEAGK